jgi:hypothetical protein
MVLIVLIHWIALRMLILIAVLMAEMLLLLLITDSISAWASLMRLLVCGLSRALVTRALRNVVVMMLMNGISLTALALAVTRALIA